MSAFMPLLAEGTRGQLDLGIHGCSDCRVAGFAGPNVFLEVRDGVHLGEESQPAYLVLEDGSQLRAMRGRVERGDLPGTAVLRMTDSFPGQRRLFSRAPLAVRTHVRSLGPGGSEWDTFTGDIGAGGVRLARRPEWDGATGCELTLAPAESVQIVVEAAVVRVEPDALGLRFTRIEPSARALLAELALAFHRAG
jgi:hypothetical protein